MAAGAPGDALRLAGPVGDAGYFDPARRGRELGDDVELRRPPRHGRPRAAWSAASAAMLVTPEWDEPYGLVAAESLACGTPVVALDRGGLREFVVAGRAASLAPARRGEQPRRPQAVATAVRLDRADCRAHAVARVLGGRDGRAATSTSTGRCPALRGAA